VSEDERLLAWPRRTTFALAHAAGDEGTDIVTESAALPRGSGKRTLVAARPRGRYDGVVTRTFVEILMRNLTVHMRRPVAILTCLAVAVLLGSVCVPESSGQLVKKSKSKKKTTPTASPAEVQKLQLRLQQAQKDFIDETANLAIEFEKAGLLEESKKLLQALQRLDGNLPGVKEKLNSLEESIMTKNPAEVSVDVSKGWNEPIARVEKGKPVRIQAVGKYRFQVASIVVGPEGFPTKDVRDLIKNVRLGALTALIIPIGPKGKPGKPGEPIEIGAGREITPKESGYLFLAVNAPPGHRSTGKLDIQLSGYVKAPR
jgi:hypothetical protein